MRRVDRTATQHNFFASARLNGVAILGVLDPNSFFAFKEDARCQRFRLNGQIGPIQNRGQIPLRRATALIVLNRQVIGPNAFLLRSVEILGRWMARLNASFLKRIKQHIRILNVGNTKRTVAAVEFV